MDDVMSARDVKEEGLRLFQEGLYPEAADRFRKARDMFVAEGDEVEAAEMLNNLGVIHRMRREWDEAIAALEEARAAFAALGDRSREAQVLGNLGGLHASQGQREEAMEYLRQAADAFAALGDHQRRGETLLALGVQQWKLGERQEGLTTYQVGLRTLDQPSIFQRILRALLSLRNRLLGAG
ncbi:MAG: tetratricopeptide repeat protein [Chloroflexota bacterium]|nr:tetratricopeptide repeat protein [Chloroflexota bacterium]